MLSPLDPNSQRFLNDLNQIEDRMQRAQRQVATGLRVMSVSDDPDQVSTILQVHASLASAQQIQANLGRVKTEADTSEQTLESAVQLVERARTLAAQGANGTQTAQTRQAAEQEVSSLLDQLVGLSRTSVEGRYIFSGDQDQQPPYSIDLTQDNPVSTYQGSAATRQVQHPNGSTFAVSKTAQDIFDAPDPTQNVFAAVNSLRLALKNNDQDGIKASMDNLSTADSYLNSQLAFYGSVQNKIADATDYGSRLQVQLKTQLSNLQDADTTQAILDLQQATNAEQVALSARAKLPMTSLFSYLG